MMTFSFFMLLMAFAVAAISFFHYTQGLFSGIISAILTIFSAVLALSYHEVVVEKLLGGQFADSANGAVLLVMFAAIYLVLRTVFDQLVPNGVQLPAMADKVGGALTGVVAGVFAAGVVAFAAQSLPFHPSILGYSRMEVEETTAGLRTGGLSMGGKTKTYPLYDAMMSDKPLHTVDPTAQQKMYLPADDILVGTAMMLSENGALSTFTPKPVASVHPDWLLELFGQRVGVQAAAKRVMINPPDGSSGDAFMTPDESHLGAGAYYLEPGHSLYQQGGEVEAVSKLKPPSPDARFGANGMGKNEIGVVVRVFFGKKAKDNRDSLIRLSMGAVRICTQKNGPEGTPVWANYYPVGTLEPSNEANVRPDDRFTVYLQRPDDFLFVDDTASGDAKVGWDVPAEAKLAGVDLRKAGGPPPERYVENVGDKGIDLVFRIETNGFLTAPADLKSKITEGSFLEVKRLARIDLGGKEMKPLSTLPRSAATRVFRKDAIKNQLDMGNSLQRAIVGNWEAPNFPDAAGDVQTASLQIRPDGTFTFGVVPLQDKGTGVRRTTGTWKYERVAGDNAIQVKFTYRENVGMPLSDSVTLTFNNEQTNFQYAGAASGAKTTSFDKKGGGVPPPTAGSPAAPPTAAPPAAAPGTTPPAPPPAPPATAAKPDPTLKATEPLDSNKFREQIGVPAGTAGEVAVAGGTVTIEGGRIKALNLPLATRAQLRGTGEPVNRLAAPDGTRTVQVECQLGTAATTGWEWLATADSLELTDSAGGKHKLAGAWAVIGDDAVTGRYATDAPASFAGFAPPAGKPSLVVLAFNVPEAAEAKELTSSNGQLWVKK